MTRSFVFTVVGMIVLLLLVTAGVLLMQDSDDESPQQATGMGAPSPDRPVGLTVQTDQASGGYILIAIIQYPSPVLLSRDGRIVKRWESDYYLGQSVYLLENGDILRTTDVPDSGIAETPWGFTNNRIEEITWDGEVVWSYTFGNDTIIGHHDIEPMPNGHILFIAYERFSEEESLAHGLNPEILSTEEPETWSEVIFELDPTTNDIVWEWHVWDHLIQEFDPDALDYGIVADHPGRININYPQVPNRAADWLHLNTVEYNADLDQIILSPRNYSEFWIIDHATTTEEAAGPAGDLLFRWGNPAAFDVGTEEDHLIYHQHDPRWIPEGYPGGGHILLFDNGGTERLYSTVIELELPVDEAGTYIMRPGEPTQPSLDDVVWQYKADPVEDFYSAYASGAQRLRNGNTLIDEALKGRIFEVTPAGDIVWEYYLPAGAWAFRAEEYDLTGMDVELAQNLEYTGGIVWGAECADGFLPRLNESVYTDAPAMQLFVETHGENAQAEWEKEACAEHGGLAG
jgi:hypothetical protein